MVRFLGKIERITVEAMSNLRSTKTGVDDAVIWISAGEFEGKKSQHGPRIKVSIGSKLTSENLRNAVSVTLTKTPKVLGAIPTKVKKQAIEFVLLNLDVLLLHWHGELDSEEVLKNIQSI